MHGSTGGHHQRRGPPHGDAPPRDADAMEPPKGDTADIIERQALEGPGNLRAQSIDTGSDGELRDGTGAGHCEADDLASAPVPLSAREHFQRTDSDRNDKS